MAAMLASTHGISHNLARLFQNKQEISIGRNPSNTLVLNATISPEIPIPDSLVLQLSRHHARLAVKDGELQLYDNGTLNGTFINNLRIPEKTWRVLKSGDVISLGGSNPLELDGEVVDNPWTFKIRSPEEFLARYTAPSSLPNAETQPLATTGVEQGPAREVYTFSTGQQARRDARRVPAPQEEANVIDLTNLDDSPPRAPAPPAVTATRPKSASRKLNKSSSQGPDTKRARPTSAGNNYTPTATAAAAAAASSGGDAGANGAVTKGIMEELTCPICQELVVAAYSLVPCGHNFCGVCLAGWLVNKQDCPNCRQRCTAPPIRQNAIDNVVSMTVAGLDEADKKVYNDRKKEWEEQRADLEPKIKDPTKFAGAAGAGSYGRGGMPRSMAQGPFVGMVPGMMGGVGNIPGLGFVLQGYPGGGPSSLLAAHQQAALARIRNQPLQASGGEQRYRCGYRSSSERCKACSSYAGASNTLMLAISRPGGGANRGSRAHWDWYHFNCFPQAGFRNARVVGFEGLRELTAADAARIRERMVNP